MLVNNKLRFGWEREKMTLKEVNYEVERLENKLNKLLRDYLDGKI